MKVLYIVSRLKKSGPTNQMYNIIHNLDRDEFTPYILTLANEPEDSCIELFAKDGVEIETLGLSRVEFIISGKKRLGKAITKIAPDLIHTSGIRADTTINMMKMDMPVCATLHNYVFEDYIFEYGKIWGIFVGIWHINAIKNMKNPICCSKTLRKKYKKLLKRDFLAIQNGVNTQYFCLKEERERMHIRQSLMLPMDKKIILVVGSIIKRKDPATVINAVRQIQDKACFEVIFVGDGELKEELQKYESEYIKFWGNKNNISDYLQAADFFISASKSEGLPTAVLEAGVCGLPMILSDIPQHREIFETKNERIAGISFFPVQNADILSKMICTYLKDCRNYSRADIGNYIKEHYDSKVMSRNYQDFYKSVLT